MNKGIRIFRVRSKPGVAPLYVLFLGLALSACGSGGGGGPSALPSIPTISNPFFSAAKQIAPASSGDTEGPLLGFDASGNASLAWLEEVNGHRELYATSVSRQGAVRHAPQSVWKGHPFSNVKMAAGQFKTYYAWMGPLPASSNCESIQEAFFLESSSISSPSSPSSPNLLSSVECSSPLYPVSDIDLAFSGGFPEQFFAAWSEGAPGKKKVYLRGYSIPSGTFKSMSLKVSNSTGDAGFPSLATGGGANADMIWVEQPADSDKRIGYARTEDGGSSLVGTSFIPSPGLDTGCPPEIGAGGGRVYIAWLESSAVTKKTLHLMTSQDHDHFSESLVLPAGQNQSGCFHLSVRKREGAYIAWEEDGEIYFIRYQPGNTNLPSRVNISKSPGPDTLSAAPRIALDGPAINVVWEEKVGGIRQVYFAGSKDAGASFSDPVNLSESSVEATSPVIQSDGLGNVSVVWTQGAPGARHIYMMTGPGARNLPYPFVSDSGITHHDVNQDGTDDILVGALSDGSGMNGKAYLFLGGSPPDTSPDVTLHGFDGPPGSYQEDLFGGATALGDINGDGAADVLIGAPGYENGKGAVYMYYGPSIHPDQPDVVIRGVQDYSRLGESLVSAGDVNGDGSDDILIGAPYASGIAPYSGEALLFLGGQFLTKKLSYPVLNPTDADHVYSGAESWAQFGMTVAGVGDINADGYYDYAIGAPSENSNHGSVSLFYGASHPPQNPGRILSGRNSGDQFGISIAAAEELNGDGYSDFLVGSMREAVTLFFGKGDPSIDFRTMTISNPESSYTGFGEAVGGTGDVNGDGYDDLLISAPYADVGDEKSVGKVYLYLGGTDVDGKPDRILIGEKNQFNFGYGALRITGDVNHDGLRDILIGASQWQGSGLSGTVYLYLGSQDWKNTETTPPSIAGSADAHFFGSSSVEHFGNALWRQYPSRNP